MNKSPKVTVYIANYNYENYIEKSIESVIAQTFTDYEILIIDDGSTDNSKAIIDKYQDRENVRVIYQQNKGLIGTINVAIKAATGKYIMRLDADDFLDENALLVMVNALEKNPKLAMVFPDYYYVDKDGNITGQERRHDFGKDVSMKDQPAHGACTLIKRDILIEVGAYSGNFTCQDGYDLWLKVNESYDVDNINLPLFYYRRHGENLTENSERLLKARSEIYREHAEKSQKPKIKTLAVIPVRGKSKDKRSVAMENLGDKPLIAWTIDEARAAENVDQVIVTTDDEELIKFVTNHYGDEVLLHKRSAESARENVKYDEAVKAAIETMVGVNTYDAVLLLTVEAPFRTSMYLDKAVNTMRIYEANTIIAVSPENDWIYQHDGQGLKTLGNNDLVSELKFEKDYLYRQVGGLMLVNIKYYFENKNILRQELGHIVLSKVAAIKVRDQLELEIARSLVEKKLIN